tara:strand:+ start:416 stop:1045 length:630 start_codon:yes stop_codon:yes gene_type:complete
MLLDSEDIKKLEKTKRLKLINSITGVKPANLIGTKNKGGISNLAIFSSVVHLGSKPPLLAFVTRTSKDVNRNTLNNILETKYYTINQIQKEFVKNAHYTSAKFNENISEFEMCKIEEENIDDFFAPFVKKSNLKIGMKLKEMIPIKSNDSTLVVGQVMKIIIDKSFLKNDFMFDLEKSGSIAIGGLNEYFTIKNLDHFPYVRLNDFPKF